MTISMCQLWCTRQMRCSDPIASNSQPQPPTRQAVMGVDCSDEFLSAISINCDG
jgi:hypothetical protein